jgi:hypothetical protein
VIALQLVLAVVAYPTVSVTPSSFAQAREPQVAIHAGQYYVVYGMGDAIYLSRSTNACATFDEPVKVGEAGRLSLGMRRGPRVCAYNGNLTVTATYGELGGGKDGDLQAFNSADNGLSWKGPVRVNGVPGSAREGLHGMAMDRNGARIACAWLDLRGKGTQIYSSVSTDYGQHWSPNVLVYASPGGTVCQCCHPSVVFANGRLTVMFRNVVGGMRDMYVVESADGGKSFGEAKKLGTGSWALDACPMDGGNIVSMEDGILATAWRRDGSVFTSGIEGDETELAPGRQPWIAASRRGPLYTWVGADGIYTEAPGVGRERIAARGDDPMVAESSGIAVAVWADGGIKARRLSEQKAQVPK